MISDLITIRPKLRKYICDFKFGAHIYPENIRAKFNLSSMQARNLCNILSDAGILKSYLGATCPHCGRIVESYSQDDEMPDTTECENCEMNEAPNHIFTTHLHLVQFFTIADNTINAPCSTPTTSK